MHIRTNKFLFKEDSNDDKNHAKFTRGKYILEKYCSFFLSIHYNVRPIHWPVTCRNPEQVTGRNEEEEFAKGPLSVLYDAVKNHTQVGSIDRCVDVLGAD